MPKTIEEHDAQLDESEILKGVPALLPPEQFRQRQRSKVMGMLNRLRSIADEDGNVEVDPDNLEATDMILGLFADADEFFETIAADRDAYVKWSTGLKDSEQVFGTLIAKYARAVGE